METAKKSPEQLDVEDFDVAVDAARKSLLNKHYHLAMGELRGAITQIESAVQREGQQ